MTMLTRRWPWLMALGTLLALLALPAAALAADFGGQVAGQHVYDRAGALTPEQVTRIEERAAAVAAAGSPVVVFLQANDSSFDQTITDGRDLMEQWDVQSAPDARDGVVIFFNLEPDDLKHGDYAVIAGQSLISGNVPQRELNRIADEMRPLLEDGDIAGAIVLALETIEHNLIQGPPPPPPPSATQKFANDVADGPVSILNLIAVVASAAAGWLLMQRAPARKGSDAPVTLATTPPDDLSPALAGSLVAGSVSDTAIGATLLDLTARGALAIEPEGKKKVQIRLLDESLVHPGFERQTWDALAARADAAGVIDTKRLGKARSSWGGLRKSIHGELVERGWFDPRAADLRLPFWITAAIVYLLAGIALVISLIAASLWGIFAVALLAALGTIAIILGSMVPSTTPAGDVVAAPWRGYKQYLRGAGKNPQVDLDLDTVVPYALALGAGQAFNKRLKEASAAGYLPAWMGGAQANGAYAAGFYPYWIAFNSSVSPSSSAGGSGASAGSGAAGGSF